MSVFWLLDKDLLTNSSFQNFCILFFISSLSLEKCPILELKIICWKYWLLTPLFRGDVSSYKQTILVHLSYLQLSNQ